MEKCWNKKLTAYTIIAVLSLVYIIAYTFNACMRDEIIYVTLYDIAIGIFCAVPLAFVIEIADWYRIKRENKEKLIDLNTDIESGICWFLTAFTRVIRECDEIILGDEVESSLMECSFDTLEEYLSMLNGKAKVIKDNMIQTLHAGDDVCADTTYERHRMQLLRTIDDEGLKDMYDDFYKTLNTSSLQIPSYKINKFASAIDIDFPKKLLNYFPRQSKRHNPNAVTLSEKNYFDSTVEIFEGLTELLKMYKDNKNSFYYKYLNERKCYTEDGLFSWSRKEKNQKNKEK